MLQTLLIALLAGLSIGVVVYLVFGRLIRLVRPLLVICSAVDEGLPTGVPGRNARQD